MFAGHNKFKSNSNIRTMQLFYELKQQYPTIPDHIINYLITTKQTKSNIEEIFNKISSQELMGRLPQSSSPTLALNFNPLEDINDFTTINERRSEMDKSVCDVNENVLIKENCVNNNNNSVKRPTFLNINKEPPNERNCWRPNNIQPSTKCRDVHKLLNQDIVSEKPPKSPLGGNKRLLNKVKKQPTSPLSELKQQQQVVKKETVSTPTQTTDTLIGNTSGSVNLSLNVNYSMDLVQTPSTSKHISSVQLTPQQPWLQKQQYTPTTTSPRSYNSVNFLMRAPSDHHTPIDITSQNSSLRYSTSSFDSKKGLQSRLEITVGPGCSNTVTASRGRPRSCYLIQEEEKEVLPIRAGSLNDLTMPDPSVISQQQVRIDNIKIELRNEKTRLIAMREEVKKLEQECKSESINIKIEEQLKREVRHLQFQCSQLAKQSHNGGFYDDLYTGPREPIIPPSSSNQQQQHGRRLPPQRSESFEEDKWNCHLCTFLNHPSMIQCEGCDMPRTTLHGTNTNIMTDSHDGLLNRFQRLNNSQNNAVSLT